MKGNELFEGLTIERILLTAGPIFLALTVHEFFHAWTALKFGDPTARDLGRVTLNPLAHLDPLGTLMLFVAGFGWAKPVPVNPLNFRNPRVADFWVSAAGPLSNFGLAILFGLIFRIYVSVEPETATRIWLAGYEFLRYSVIINVVLAIFNLIPLYPLDGSHVLRNLLPPMMAAKLDQIQKYGPYILIGLVILGRFGGGLWIILRPPVSFFTQIFAGFQF